MSEQLKWLDLTSKPDTTKDKKIDFVKAGELMMCYFVIPVLNEKDNIPTLVDSIRRQQTKHPVSVIIVDNGSTDGSPEIAKRLGANVTYQPIRGIGPGRQKGIEYLSTDLWVPSSNALVFQTDADCVATNDNLVEEVANKYLVDQNIMASVGPTNYDVPLEDGNVVNINTGREFGNMFGTKGLRQYFEECGRKVEDYLLSAPHYYMIGPNSVYRKSVFSELGIRYPMDNSWESIDISIRLQILIDSSRQIKYIPEQNMTASSRGILKGNEVLTDERKQEINKQQFIEPFKTGNNFLSPEETVARILDKIDGSK